MPIHAGGSSLHLSLNLLQLDSEDIPLNISREGMQDSRLLGKISNVLTKRLLKHFAEVGGSGSLQFATT